MIRLIILILAASVSLASAETKRKSTPEADKQKQAEIDAAEFDKIPRETLEKGCILAAGERLPRIPGLTVLASKALPMPAEFKTDRGSFMVLVHIDVSAVGQNTTYKYVCAKGLKTPYFVYGYER